MNPFLRKSFIITFCLFIFSLFLVYGVLFHGYEKKWQWEQPKADNLSNHNFNVYGWTQKFTSPTGVLIKSESESSSFDIDLNGRIYRQNTPRKYSLYFADKKGVRFISSGTKETFYNAYCSTEKCILFFDNSKQFLDLKDFSLSPLKNYTNRSESVPLSLIGGKILSSPNSSALVLADNTKIYFSENEGDAWHNEIDVEALVKQYYAEDFGQFTSLYYAISGNALLIFYNNDLATNTFVLALDLTSKKITQTRWLPLRIRQLAQNEKGDIYCIALNASRDIYSIMHYQSNGEFKPLFESGYTYLDDLIVNNNNILVNYSIGDNKQSLTINLATQKQQYSAVIDSHAIFNPAASSFIRFPYHYSEEKNLLLLGERVKYEYVPIN